MKKLSVLIAFAALVGVASAGGIEGGKSIGKTIGLKKSIGGKVGAKVGLEEDIGVGGFEGGHIPHHGFGGLHAIDDIILIEELRRRGHHGIYPGFGHVPHGPGPIIPRPRGPRRGAAGGIGGIGGAGGIIGANQRGDAHLGALNARHHDASHNLVEGAKGGIIGGSGGFDVDHHRSDHNTVEAGTKHSVIDKDQLLIRNKVNGFTDQKGFRTSHGSSEDDHLGAGGSVFAGGAEAGRAEHDHENDNELNALNAGVSESSSLGAAGGAIGAAGAGGALVD